MIKNSSAIEVLIEKIFTEVYEEQNDGQPAPKVEDSTALLETGLDSLGFAILVSRLHEELGYDPFVTATEAFYPKTFGEFVNFYKSFQS